MLILLVLVGLMVVVAAGFMVRMQRRDHAVSGLIGLVVLIAAAVLGSVYGVLNSI